MLHAREQRVLAGVVGTVLGRNLQHGGNGLFMLADDVPDHVGDRLANQQHRDVVARGELLERRLDRLDGRLCGRG